MTPIQNSENFTYLWKVENFSSWVQKRGERVKSPWFSADTLHETKWRLDLYPRGIDNGNEICISCYLCRAEKDRGDDNVTIGFEFEILGADGFSLLTKRVESFTFKRKESLGWPDFKSLNEIFRDKCVFLPRDTLTIRCYMWGSFPRNFKATRHFALSEIGVGGCSFKYSVKLFSLETPLHYFVPGPWRIELTFLLAEDDSVCVKIRKFGEVSYNYILQCKIILLDAEGLSLEVRQSEHIILPKHEVKIWEFPPFMKKSKLLEEKKALLGDDEISFLCEFSIINDTEINKLEVKPEIQTKRPASITIETDDDFKQDLYRLMSDSSLYDVTLKADNKTFPAHKALLSARSAYFADLFSRDKSITTVDIPNLTLEILSLLLKFIYTDVLVDLEFESAKNLFIAGVEYKVQSLKRRCAAHLKLLLDNKTVYEILSVADDYKDEDLKNSAIEYVKQNTNEVLVSSDWKILIENNSKLVTEILCKLSVKIGKN